MGDFGTVLREIRLKRRMTQQELADMLGTSKQVVSRYENGINSPKLSTVKDYAQKLGLSTERMFKTYEEIRNALPQSEIDAAHGDLDDAFEFAIMMGDIEASHNETENEKKPPLIALLDRGMEQMSTEEQERLYQLVRIAFPKVFPDEDAPELYRKD